MEGRKARREGGRSFQDKFYYDYPSYKKEERREGRPRLRRADSHHSRRPTKT